MDVILELGGNVNRMQTVKQLATENKTAKIIVSSESPPTAVVDILSSAGIGYERFLLDFNAWDTVTNFTETVKLIKLYQPRRLFIVTDYFHMRRAMAIAKPVYALSGIKLVPVPFMGGDIHYKEPLKLILEDAGRAWVWRLTGKLIYDQTVKDQRMPGINADKQLAISKGYPVTR
jgi:hypothetical protein